MTLEDLLTRLIETVANQTTATEKLTETIRLSDGLRNDIKDKIEAATTAPAAATKATRAKKAAEPDAAKEPAAEPERAISASPEDRQEPEAEAAPAEQAAKQAPVVKGAWTDEVNGAVAAFFAKAKSPDERQDRKTHMRNLINALTLKTRGDGGSYGDVDKLTPALAKTLTEKGWIGISLDALTEAEVRLLVDKGMPRLTASMFPQDLQPEAPASVDPFAD